jgi:hypothetical protein
LNDKERREKETNDQKARFEEMELVQALKVQDRKLKRAAVIKAIAEGAIRSEVDPIRDEIGNLDAKVGEPF